MIDKLLLFPYYLALKTRHRLYDKGAKKSREAAIPTVCIGNIAVGGTGKTPHTEMVLELLQDSDEWGMRSIAMLSRGYKRSSKGFQQVLITDDASFAGDEPAQIKKNYPGVTVAVCKDRLTGLDFLAHPEKLASDKKASKCIHKEFEPAEIAVLDDAFQHRALKPTVSIVLSDFNRPETEDMLLPLGRLRDLPTRLHNADIVIITKCPVFLEDWEKTAHIKKLGLSSDKKVFFTSINYQPLKPVFQEEHDNRYCYSSRAIVFSGIANDTPLLRYLSDTFKITAHFRFADHKKFSKSDIAKIESMAKASPTAAVITTEKDAMRILACKYISEELKKKLFYVPIKVEFTDEEDKAIFRETLLSSLRKLG